MKNTTNKTKNAQKIELATFGAGCFWHVEDAFRNVKGVIDAFSGYSGGNMKNPTYEDVCSGKTGHAEVVQVEYDPQEVSYEELLDVFWNNHNPTQVNRQGPDVGYQYRSVIFYHNEKQKETAMKSKEKLDKSGKWKSPIATSIEPVSTFYKAEEYHQKYLEKHGMSSCHI
jgi:peptide-methionine (S)-S-oxide reductase